MVVRVVMTGWLRSGPNEEPIAWSGNIREFCNLPGIVDTYLLVTGSVQLDAVEHAH